MCAVRRAHTSCRWLSIIYIDQIQDINCQSILNEKMYMRIPLSSVHYEIDSAHEKLMKSFSDVYFHNLIPIIDQIVDCSASSFDFSPQKKKCY